LGDFLLGNFKHVLQCRSWITGRLCLLTIALQLAVFCVSGMALASQTQSAEISSSDQQDFQAAMSAMDRGDAQTAEPLLKKLHIRHPRSFEINESLGLLYAGQDNLQAARPLMEAAVAERPSSDVAHANLGAAYFKLSRNPEAARELERAAELNPQNSATRIALGKTWMELKQPQKAATAFNAALSEGSADPTLPYNAALAYFQCGDYAKAAPLLARMPDVASSAEAQSLYGDVDEKLGEYKDAAQHYATAVQLAPTEANEYVLGIEFLRHWTFGPAVQLFTAGVDHFPDSRRMHVGLGIAYYANGDYDKAIHVFSQLLESDTTNIMYAELLGRTCTVLTQGSDPQCVKLIPFAQGHPSNAMLATYAATSILHQPSDAGQLKVAQQLLEDATKAAPNLPEARYGMGLLLQTQSKWQQSIPELEAAIRLKPDYASAHYRLALAWSHTGQREKAQGEIALEQKYSAEEHNDLDVRLKQVKTLLVNIQ
jgi:tetratricopeptide (TPR) repeat protein